MLKRYENRMDLHELLISPGTHIDFHRELDTDRLDFSAVREYTAIPVADGSIFNNAGALTLRGRIRAQLSCVCDRCADEFDKTVDIPLEVPLATELQDEENPDYFLLSGDDLDIDDLLETCFILDMDMQFLCKPDCKGLCSRCGANLNRGQCSCTKELDPRLAVLEQLLDNKDQTT